MKISHKEQEMIRGRSKDMTSKISSYTIIILCAFIMLISGICVSPAYAASGTGVWVPETVDSPGDVGTDSSVAVDSTGRVHISYYDAGNGDLKHAVNDAGIWVIETVDNTGDVGWYSSLAIDSAGKLHIGYYDLTNGNLKYVVTNAAGSWATPVIVDGTVGNRGKYLSLALDSSDNAHISYYDLENGNLKYATSYSPGPPPPAGTPASWSIQTVDSTGDIGWDTSIAIDSGGKAHISYYDAGNMELKYATNASGLWVPVTVDSEGDVGLDTSLAVDPTGMVHISYYDFDNRNLKHASGTPGAWVIETIDSIGDVGVNTSLYIDSSGSVRIGYYDYSNGTLKYTGNISGTWMIETVDGSGDVGGFVSITGDSGGDVHISYYDQTHGDLRYAVKKGVETLKKGFNFIGAPTSSSHIPDAHTFLASIPGKEKSVSRVIRYDQSTGQAQEAFFNPNGSMGGTNFTITAGEGLIVYALKDTEFELPNDTCPQFDLKAGTNWAGTPCKPTHATAFSMLGAIGSDNAISIQQFNPDTGRFETAGFRNGVIVGVDFPLLPGKGYFVHMK